MYIKLMPTCESQKSEPLCESMYKLYLFRGNNTGMQLHYIAGYTESSHKDDSMAWLTLAAHMHTPLPKHSSDLNLWLGLL